MGSGSSEGNNLKKDKAAFTFKKKKKGKDAPEKKRGL